MSAAEIERRAQGDRASCAAGRPASDAPLRAGAHGRRIDPRRCFRRSLRTGGATIDLAFRAPIQLRQPPIVALCDISGSMSEYTRLFLHFLHALGETRRVTTFLFGTRLTNVTRACAPATWTKRLRNVRPGEGLGRRHAHRLVAARGSTGNGRGACWARARSASCSPTGSNETTSTSSRSEMERLAKSCAG